MFFASDNTSPAPPQIMQALTDANEAYHPSYGADALTARATARIQNAFETPDAAVYFVGTGTAANALALACLCPPWGTVLCHEQAHIEVDECGAPEFFSGGAKLTLLPGDHGKIAPETMGTALAAAPIGDVHAVQPAALSLSNVTEAGTVYTPQETRAICDIAKAHSLRCHLDGSRLANALATQNCTPADLTWKAGIDAVSLGGTKNGLLGAEAVIIFDPELAWEFELRRKRGGHLFSKHRYLAAQMDAYLQNDLWMGLATQANAAAQRLTQGLRTLPDATLEHPVDANILFATLPRAFYQRASAAGAMFSAAQSLDGPDDAPVTARLVCSWCTTAEQIDQFLDILRG